MIVSDVVTETSVVQLACFFGCGFDLCCSKFKTLWFQFWQEPLDLPKSSQVWFRVHYVLLKTEDCIGTGF